MRNETRTKMPNLGVAIWWTILNIKLLWFPRCVPELLLSHLPKFIEFYVCITIKNLSWPHFSWPTLYTSCFFWHFGIWIYVCRCLCFNSSSYGDVWINFTSARSCSYVDRRFCSTELTTKVLLVYIILVVLSSPPSKSNPSTVRCEVA